MVSTGNKNHKNDTNISRRRFFSLIGYALIAVTGYFLLRAQRIHLKTKAIKQIPLPEGLAEGIHFLDQLIYIKNKGEEKVFLARCTHLGCRINESKGDELLCPCHGSRFSMKGAPLKGPANRNLKELKINTSKNGRYIEI